MEHRRDAATERPVNEDAREREINSNAKWEEGETSGRRRDREGREMQGNVSGKLARQKYDARMEESEKQKYEESMKEAKV